MVVVAAGRPAVAVAPVAADDPAAGFVAVEPGVPAVVVVAGVIVCVAVSEPSSLPLLEQAQTSANMETDKQRTSCGFFEARTRTDEDDIDIVTLSQ